MTAAEWTAVMLSLKVASVGALASLPVAILVAWLLARGRFPGRTALDILVHLPLVMPPILFAATASGLMIENVRSIAICGAP